MNDYNQIRLDDRQWKWQHQCRKPGGSGIRSVRANDDRRLDEIPQVQTPWIGDCRKRQRKERTDLVMKTYIALLRAVNVGGTGQLPMSELKKMCEDAGFQRVQTYIASGNVIFDSTKSAKIVKSMLEKKLLDYAGKDVAVIVRTAAELREVLDASPYPDRAANRTVTIFLDDAPPADALKHATGMVDEEAELGAREIYVHYGEGMGKSKLKIPAAKSGTARNMNTIAKLVELAEKR